MSMSDNEIEINYQLVEFPKFRLAYLALEDFSFWQNASADLSRGLLEISNFTPVNNTLHLYFFNSLEQNTSCWVAKEVVGYVPENLVDELPFSLEDLERGEGVRMQGSLNNPNLRHLLQEHRLFREVVETSSSRPLADAWRLILSMQAPFRYQLDLFFA